MVQVNKNKSKVVSAHATKAWKGNGSTAPFSPNPCTRRRWVVNFMLQLIYHQERILISTV